MKSKELIRQLQELDPTGEVEVFGDGDIYFAEILPWYYDGRPDILIHDESKKPYYHIAGMRQITAEDKKKIYLKCMTLEDIVWDDYKNTGIYEGDERFMERVKKAREERDEIDYRMDIEFLFEFCAKNLPSVREANITNLFKKYEKELRRKDFNSLGSSINDKKTRYYKDCLKEEGEGMLTYVRGHEDKNYNDCE